MRRGRKSRSIRAASCLGAFGALLIVLFFSTGSAMASRGHAFSGSFGGHCLAEPCEGTFKEPSGVAVNEATGEVYVVDRGESGVHGRVVRFNEEGQFVSEFNGSGALAGEEHAAGSLKEPGEIETGRFEEPEGIAIDNSEGASKGDVYVVDAGAAHRVIDKYSSAGEYLGQIAEAEGTPFQGHPLDGVAVDPEGVVWVYREAPGDEQLLQRNAERIPAKRSFALGAGFGRPGAAVDSKGSFYVRYLVVGGARIAKDDHTGAVQIKEIDEKDSSAVAVDQTTDDSFIDNITSVRVSNPEGAELERLGEEEGEKHLSEGHGGRREGRRLRCSSPTPPAMRSCCSARSNPPRRRSKASRSRTSPRKAPSFAAKSTRAAKSAKNRPNTSSSTGAARPPATCSSSPYEATAPVPPGQVEADFGVHSVSAPIEGLSASATYHFRLLARNEHGEGQPGEEEAFTTQSAGGKLTLPDDRGWELVSPPDKQGALIAPISERRRAGGGGRLGHHLPDERADRIPAGRVLKRSAGALKQGHGVVVLARHRDRALGPTGFAVGPGPEYKLFDRELSRQRRAAVRRVHPGAL